MKEKDKVFKFATSAEMAKLLREGARYNGTRFPTKKLIAKLDPTGVNLLSFSMDHNDLELRTHWFLKVEGKIDPVEIWMDIAYKSKAFGTYSQLGFASTDGTFFNKDMVRLAVDESGALVPETEKDFK